MLKLKDLARSEYYDVLKEYYEIQIQDLQQPEETPIADLVIANVKREKILWLQNTLKHLQRLRVQDNTTQTSDSYE